MSFRASFAAAIVVVLVPIVSWAKPTERVRPMTLAGDTYFPTFEGIGNASFETRLNDDGVVTMQLVAANDKSSVKTSYCLMANIYNDQKQLQYSAKFLIDLSPRVSRVYSVEFQLDQSLKGHLGALQVLHERCRRRIDPLKWDIVEDRDGKEIKAISFR